MTRPADAIARLVAAWERYKSLDRFATVADNREFAHACREGVPALLARVAELERDCKRLRESLEYIPWIAKEGRAKPENKLVQIARYARSRSGTGGEK